MSCLDKFKCFHEKEECINIRASKCKIKVNVYVNMCQALFYKIDKEEKTGRHYFVEP